MSWFQLEFKCHDFITQNYRAEIYVGISFHCIGFNYSLNHSPNNNLLEQVVLKLLLHAS